MSWRERIAQRLIEAAKARDARIIESGVGYPRAYPDKYPNAYENLVSPHVQQQQMDAIGSAEQMYNRAQGNRLQAAEEAQQQLNTLRATPGANTRNATSLEDTLGVLQSEHPLDQWWNIK